ncbi:hypothetical protein GA0061099_1005405 [Bradyrhizobium yuanmingense]|uniref:Phosphoribosyltransferase n=1 Tax=Bradyrhizobium yuanmingense TaxID=108015 RepID=A0A1C3W725_9BRAD|nr:hypothetical protein [Bradyrhizobium yuanmingense]TWI27384.1 hypothetical protein IQ15_02919 [Bradyrhizobium yuanmingense]SCB35987.1 hypothetical protein GA0061099_1005405 [Bradyrhizobium yuanmingense]
MSAVRFQKIEDHNRPDHHYLTAEDSCIFLYEYTRGMGFAHSETNSLILNLKKKKNSGGYHWKADAIAKCAAAIGPALNPLWLAEAVLVPVPPSKAKTDEFYDDRMTRVCKAIVSTVPIDVREIVYQIQSTDAVHDGNRLSPAELRNNYKIDENLCSPGDPKYIGIVDDMLTAGAHFRAMKDILKARFPTSIITGIFIARRVFPNSGAVSLDDLLA